MLIQNATPSHCYLLNFRTSRIRAGADLSILVRPVAMSAHHASESFDVSTLWAMVKRTTSLHLWTTMHPHPVAAKSSTTITRYTTCLSNWIGRATKRTAPAHPAVENRRKGKRNLFSIRMYVYSVPKDLYVTISIIM